MSDDASDDDEALKPLRAVWLSMRDEEPPSGGMAALMAAAREKAEQMAEAQKPSAWDRFVALFRRPPVLALAGVCVLVSGVLVFGRGDRGEQMRAPAQPTTVTPTSETTSETTPSPPPHAADMAGSSATAATPVEEDKKVEPVEERLEPTPERIQRPRPQVVRPPADPPPPTSGEKQVEKKPSGGRGEGAGIVDTETANGPTGTSEPGPEGDAVATDGAVRQTPRAPTTAPRTTTIALAKKSEDAAARGDCMAVKQNAQELSRLDRPSYDALVKRNAAVARCLRQ